MRISSPRGACSPLAVVRKLIVALAMLATTAPALAQGTMGTLPDPISVRELEDYAERLNLSPQQLQAIEPFHEQYREEFRILRESEIEKFVQNSRSWQGGPFGMMGNREDAEKNLRELESLLNKIKSLDNRFFDQVQSILTEDQVLLMPSGRQARERARYRTGLSRMTGMMNPASQVDLSELAGDLKLTPDERQAIGPVVAQYESSLTSLSRKLHDRAISMSLETLEKMRAQGLDGNNPRRDGWQSMRTILAETNLKLMEQAAEISELNRRTARSLAPLLTPENSRALRQQYYQRGYAEAMPRGGNATRAFETALKLDDLTPEQRQTVTALADELRTSADRITEQMIDLIDAQRKTQTFFDFDMEARRKHEEQLGELRDKRAKASQSALESLRATLGPELSEKLDQRVAEAATDERSSRETAVVGMMPPGMGGAVVARVEQSSGALSDTATVDRFVPGPISRRDVDSYAQTLKLSNEDRAVLDSLHENYLAEFKIIEESQIKAVHEAQKNQWAFNTGAGEINAPRPEDIDQLYTLRRAALSAIMSLDREFFEDVRVTMVTDESAPLVQRLEQSRQRQIYARAASDEFERRRGGGPGQRMGRIFGQSAEAPVDLSTVVASLAISPMDAPAFQAALDQYEQSVTDSFAKMYDATMRMQQSMDKFMAEMATQARNERDGGGEARARRVDFGGGFRQIMEGENRAAGEARRAITTLNRATLDSFKTMLPEAQAQQLVQEYNRLAFASVYRDPRSAEPHLAAALALDDLTPQQSTQVQEIAAEFHASYDALSEQLVELEANRPNPGASPENRDWRGAGDQMRNREKLQFERNDLNHKALSKLRAALNQEQIARLGGLEVDSGQRR